MSIWSGWVGLGQLCGFGVIHPLPGIADGLALNTAITLPVGVEAYGAYALGAWLGLAADHPARTFARRSAIGALVLGMLGQVVYHLLAAAHATRAPWPVAALVSCLPVVTLGFGAALTHLLRAAPQPASEPDAPAPEIRLQQTDLNGHGHQAAELFAAELAAGRVPGLRAIQAQMQIGQPKAQAIQAHLRQLTST